MPIGVNLTFKCLSHRRFTPLSPPDALGGKRNPVPSPMHRGGLGWGNAVSDGKPEN
jgi:hypothetical protein